MVYYDERWWGVLAAKNDWRYKAKAPDPLWPEYKLHEPGTYHGCRLLLHNILNPAFNPGVLENIRGRFIKWMTGGENEIRR